MASKMIAVLATTSTVLMSLALSPNARADVHAHVSTIGDREVVHLTNDRPWPVQVTFDLIYDYQCRDEFATRQHFEGRGLGTTVNANGDTNAVYYFQPCASSTQVFGQPTFTWRSATRIGAPAQSNSIPIPPPTQVSNGDSQAISDDGQNVAPPQNSTPGQPQGGQSTVVLQPTITKPTATDPDAAWQDFVSVSAASNFTDFENSMNCSHETHLRRMTSSCDIQIETKSRCRPTDCATGDCSFIDVDRYDLDMARVSQTFCPLDSEGGCNLEFSMPAGSMHHTGHFDDNGNDENSHSKNDWTDTGFMQFNDAQQGQQAAAELVNLKRLCAAQAPPAPPQASMAIIPQGFSGKIADATPVSQTTASASDLFGTKSVAFAAPARNDGRPRRKVSMATPAN